MKTYVVTAYRNYFIQQLKKWSQCTFLLKRNHLESSPNTPFTRSWWDLVKAQVTLSRFQSWFSMTNSGCVSCCKLGAFVHDFTIHMNTYGLSTVTLGVLNTSTRLWITETVSSIPGHLYVVVYSQDRLGSCCDLLVNRLLRNRWLSYRFMSYAW